MASVNDTTNLKVDKPLTNFSLEQPQGEFVYDKLGLIVPVQKISDKIRVRANDKFKQMDTLRTGKAASNKLDRSEGTPIVYSCDDHALHDIVTDRDAANVDQPIMLMEESVRDLTSVINLTLEREVATELTTVANWGANTSDPTHEWDDYDDGTPIVDIDTARIAMWDASKVIPNKIVLPYEVAVRLSNHPDIIDLMKYTRTEEMTLAAEISLPSRIFGMDVVIASASYNNANLGEAESLAEIWGTGAILLYIGANTRNTFTAAKVFQYADLQVRRERITDPSGTKIIASRDYDVKFISASAGYYLQNRLS